MYAHLLLAAALLATVCATPVAASPAQLLASQGALMQRLSQALLTSPDIQHAAAAIKVWLKARGAGRGSGCW